MSQFPSHIVITTISTTTMEHDATPLKIVR